MHVLAVANQKGGVGKTTTAVNVAASLAELGRRTLLVDLCSQGHASAHLGMRLDVREDDSAVYKVLAKGRDLADHVRASEYGIELLAGGTDVAAAEALMSTNPSGLFVLREALAEVGDRWDVVVLDCPPSLGHLSQAALVAATAVLVPMLLQAMPMDGFIQLMNRVDEIRRRHNPELKIAGIVATNSSKKSSMADQMRDMLAEHCGPTVFEREIRTSEYLSGAYFAAKPVTAYAPGSNGALDYRWLSQALVDRGAV